MTAIGGRGMTAHRRWRLGALARPERPALSALYENSGRPANRNRPSLRNRPAAPI
jgi:hypothetical protein